MSKDENNVAVSDMFERDFLEIPLEKQIKNCEKYEIAPLFRKWLPEHVPVLEAGCGSGRWCAWFKGNGWETVGLDWSEALCERARKEVSNVEFVSGDMQETEFPDGRFGSIVALGSVEHVKEGPLRALKEFHRILRSGGVAIVTVPHGGALRRLIRLLTRPVLWVKSTQRLRRIMKKKGANGISLYEAERGCCKQWAPQFKFNEKGCYFFQYEFTNKQMMSFFHDAGFIVEEEFVAFSDEGVFHNFGRLAACWDERNTQMHLTLLGRIIKRVLRVDTYGHMLCYVVRRSFDEGH